MERPRGSAVVGVLAAALAVALAVVVTGPWTQHPFTIGSSSLWTVSATSAVGAALTLLGAAAVAVAQVVRRTGTWSTRLAVVGCLVAALGVGMVLVGIRALPSGSIHPVTVAIGQFTIGPNQFPPGSSSNAAPRLVFIGVVGLVVLTVVGALLRVRVVDLDTSTATRPVAVVAGLGLVVLVLGASLLPWSDSLDPGGRSLWRSSTSLAVAAAVLLLMGVAAVLLVRRSRPAPGIAAAVAVVAGLAGAVIVTSRLPFLDTLSVRYSTSFLVAREFMPASPAALAAAKTVVYSGIGLILLAALAAVSLSALRGGATNLPDRPLPGS